MRNSILIIASLFIAATGVHAQESGMKPNELMLKYRDMALDYNHDIRSAKENISAYMNLSGAAKADLKPKVSANAAYQYVDKPMELSFSIPSFDTPLGFQGAHNNYAATLAITQPIYSGGRLTQFVKKSGYQKDYAVNEMAMMKDVVSQQSDVTYWSCVARKEIAGVIEESKNSVGKLVTLIKQRVDLGYTDPGDLLMAEVKYNEIEYLYQQAQTSFATTVMALNSLIGVDLDNQTEVDSVVEPFTTTGWVSDLSSNTRPEEKMARNMISITESDKKIVNSKYRPQLNLRIEGSYKNPAYDFSREFKPNYAVMANFSMPVFEWGKMNKESRAAKSKVNIASQSLQKTIDRINLEVSTSRLSLIQAIEQVNLTDSSLFKAFENERLATEQYSEGRISVVDLLQAQLYRQNAQINYIQAKLNAQNSWSELQRALNLYK